MVFFSPHYFYWANHISLSSWLPLTRVDFIFISPFSLPQRVSLGEVWFLSDCDIDLSKLAHAEKECSSVTFWIDQTENGWKGADQRGIVYSFIWEGLRTCSCRSYDNTDRRVIPAKPLFFCANSCASSCANSRKCTCWLFPDAHAVLVYPLGAEFFTIVHPFQYLYFEPNESVVWFYSLQDSKWSF